jgi:hypothetical protein
MFKIKVETPNVSTGVHILTPPPLSQTLRTSSHTLTSNRKPLESESVWLIVSGGIHVTHTHTHTSYNFRATPLCEAKLLNVRSVQVHSRMYIRAGHTRRTYAHDIRDKDTSPESLIGCVTYAHDIRAGHTRSEYALRVRAPSTR